MNLEKEEIDPQGRPRISRKAQEEHTSETPRQGELFGYPGDDLIKELDSVDPNDMTPIEALNLLADWKKKFS